MAHKANDLTKSLPSLLCYQPPVLSSNPFPLGLGLDGGLCMIFGVALEGLQGYIEVSQGQQGFGPLPEHPTLSRQSSLTYILGFSPTSHGFREMASL